MEIIGFGSIVFVLLMLSFIHRETKSSLQELKEIRKILEQRNPKEEAPPDHWPSGK